MAAKIVIALLLLQGMSLAVTPPVFRKSALGEMIQDGSGSGKTVAGAGDGWFRPDKAQHFVANVMMTTFVFSSSRKFFDTRRSDSRAIALLVSSAVSISKELWDLKVRHRYFSKKDLAADLLGVVAGLILISQ